MQVPKRPDLDRLDGEHLAGRMLRVEVTAGNRAEKFIEGMMEQVGVREKKMQRIKWRQPIGCGHPERIGPKGGDESNQNSSLANPQNLYDSAERLSKNTHAVTQTQPLFKNVHTA